MIANKFNFARKEKNNYVAGLDSQRCELIVNPSRLDLQDDNVILLTTIILSARKETFIKHEAFYLWEKNELKCNKASIF